MSIPTKEKIYNTIKNDLFKIRTENGYNNTIEEVVYGKTYLEDIQTFPSACFYLQSPGKLIAEQESTEYQSFTIAIEVHLNTTPSTIIHDKESMYYDLDRLYSNDGSILDIYRSDLNKSNIKALKHVSFPFFDETIEHNQTSQTVSILLQIEYIKDRNNIAGISVTPVIPNILNSYTLTSSFIASTGNLQSQISSISGIAISGINTWGSIEGTLSNQTDLQNELNARSLTGHTHSEYFLNSLSGSLTTDLSGYSVTSHNHNLNDLTEKSYTSLTDTPNLGAYSITGHAHNQYATSASLTGATIWDRNSSLANTFTSNTGDKVGIGTQSPSACVLHLNRIGTNTAPFLKMTGTGTYPAGPTDEVHGAAFSLIYNTAGNRQFWIGDSLAGNGIRFNANVLDAWNNNSAGNLDLKLGNVGNNVLINGTYVGIGLGTVTPTHKLSVSGNVSITGNLILSTSSTPASVTATGIKGTIIYDDNYLYVCTNTNTWRRSSLTSW